MKPTTFISALAGFAVSVQAAVIARQDAIPEEIFPGGSYPIPQGTMQVSIGFLYGLNWNFVARNTNAAAQIFKGLPEAFAQASTGTVDSVVSADSIYVEKLFPYNTEETLGYNTTVARVHYPKDKVQFLARMIEDKFAPPWQINDALLSSLVSHIDNEFDIFGVYK